MISPIDIKKDKMAPVNNICICICTYKRNRLLEHLLIKLQNQQTDGLFTYSIVVVDNDNQESARNTVEKVREKAAILINYFVEPQKNIALARNKAILNAKGDYIAFIDDDELPCDAWLLNLLNTCNEHRVDGVLGPVIPDFEMPPPDWILKGNLCSRPTYKTGAVMHWSNCRTGNTLLKLSLFMNGGCLFDAAYGIQGEDVNFFKKVQEKGHFFVWCNEAPVYEVVPPERSTRRYFLKRAFLQGNVSLRYDKESVSLITKAWIFAKSATATIIYTLFLPIAYLSGMHHFIKYLIKDVHHISRLLALLKIYEIKERNI